ncbi:uncharacterized protein [Drosophila bipectinata]|uniref:uncharacterized protein n=1 Tax=Drosophila bipectinata TaxID=42026 RepID=UPI001C8A0D5E|nr:uncharacterized protein LOC108119067 [Drosophila bipectinata]XP_043066900.1 uncharacterized protein LOC108119067 [Drosophila bipectinata]XP_043066903.1 uncharacterized protein LOC108119067 [Drosophila bipectinata]
MESKLLEVSPEGPLTFSTAKNAQELFITNVSGDAVTYKLQSTVFGKFSIRPRWGVLRAKEQIQVMVSMSREAELSKKGRDKIVILCMKAPMNEVDYEATASFWRRNICYNPRVEKHQVICQEDSTELKDHKQEASQSKASLRTERKIWR